MLYRFKQQILLETVLRSRRILITETALCYYSVHIKMFLNSTLHYSREAILGFTPTQLHVGQRVLSLFCASSTESVSILATVTKS